MNAAHRTVLVTGGAGFVGGHLVDWILACSPARVRVLDNLHGGRRGLVERVTRSRRVEFVEADVRDREAIRAAVKGADVVFHLASQSRVMEAAQDIEYSFTTNVLGTFNVLLAAHEAGVGRVVFTSSREVYGEPRSVPVSEQHPTLPKNAHGASKVAAEAYCRAFRQNYGLDVRVLRLANVYGPGDRDRVIPRFCRWAGEGRPLAVYGGAQTLDFVWIGDVVRALGETAQAPAWDGPVNVGSGQGITILDLAERVKALFGRSDLALRIESPRPEEVSCFVADVRQLRARLGWAPNGNLLDHLAETAQSYA